MALLGQLIDDVVVHRVEIKGQLRIGRHHSSDLLIDEDAVSGRHAIISSVANPDFPGFKEFYIEDLGSTNGTFINDEKISEKIRLHDNDIVRIAWNKFKFMDDKESGYDKTMHIIE